MNQTATTMNNHQTYCRLVDFLNGRPAARLYIEYHSTHAELAAANDACPDVLLGDDAANYVRAQCFDACEWMADLGVGRVRETSDGQVWIWRGTIGNDYGLLVTGIEIKVAN